MQLYTHEELDGVYGNASFTLPDGRWFPAVWWQTATEDEIADAGFSPYAPPEEELPPPNPEQVDAERDRRVIAGFTFAGKLYQSRNEDRENISGAALAALAAQINGAEPEDYRWHGGGSDFVWIAADNSLSPMDAQTMFTFGQAAMAHKQAHIFAARTLKDTNPIPLNFREDTHWPSVYVEIS
jgi:hypothetical protein